MVLLAPTVTSSDTLGGMSRICWTSCHCIQHNENSTYAGPAKAITGSVLKSQALKWGTSLCWGVSLPRTYHDCRLEMIRILKNNSGGQIAVGNMLVRKFSFAPIEEKIQLFKSYCYPIYVCELWRHLSQKSIRKLTVSYSDTFKHLINVPIYTSSSPAFAMNATDHINMVLSKFAYSLMNRVVASPNSIVTAIVNS